VSNAATTCADSLIHTLEIARAPKCCLERTFPDPLAQVREQSN